MSPIIIIITTFQLILFSQMMSLRAGGNEWSVQYSQQNLCALKGSTVFMNGTYTHPTGVTEPETFWFIRREQNKESTDLQKEAGYSGRVKYLNTKQKLFSFRLSDVKKSDEHIYYVRIKTNKEKVKWTGEPGVTLNVTELTVEAPDKVLEGNKTVLLCNTTCILSGTPAFVWYKNGLIVDTTNTKSNTLTLQRVKVDNAGNYTCAVKGHERLRSPALSLRVRYPPRNISVSISPSGGIVEGGLVIMTCSGDAVVNYTWFKGIKSVGKGKTFSISNVRSEDTGEYKCKCSNEVGQQYSRGVTLNLAESMGWSSRRNAAIAAILAFLLSVLLILILVLLRREKTMCCWSEAHNIDNGNAANHATLFNSHSASMNEVQHPRKAKDSAEGVTQEVLYANVQHQRDKVGGNHHQDDVQYTTLHISSSHQRTDAGTSGSSSIIYSAVK